MIRGVALPAVPCGERVRHICEELFAIHLYLSVVAHRRDWLLGSDGVHFLRKLLFELDLEEQGRPQAASVRDWSGRLSSEQRDELLALPTGTATRAGVIDGHVAVREAFARRGRRLAGDGWPSALERAVVTHLDTVLAS
jgi:hypothetical protein